MSQHTMRHVSTNIPSARTTIKSAVSSNSRPTIIAVSRASDADVIDYNMADVSRKEAINKEREANRAWAAKFDPWLIDEYRQMYDNIAKVHGISRENCLISLKRNEWQQSTDVFPPLHKRLAGQRRRRLLGAFPQTENDNIGWRMLPQQAVERYGRTGSTNVIPLPKQYKITNCPIESFY